MNQHAVTLLIYLANAADAPRVAAWLCARGDALQADPAQSLGLRGVAQLHFLSIFLLPEDDQGEPRIVFEANFDGDERAFFEALLGASPDLEREVLRRCYGWPADLAAQVYYLRARKVSAELFFVGNPGRSVQQIEAEAGLAERVEQALRALPELTGRRSAHMLRLWRSLLPGDRQLVFETPPRPWFTRERLLERPLGVIYGWLRWPFIVLAGAFFTLVALQYFGYALPEAVAPPAEVVATSLRWAKCLLWLLLAVAVLLILQLGHEFPLGLRPCVRRAIRLAKIGEIVGTSLRALPDFALLVGLVALFAWHWDLIAWLYIWLLMILLLVALAGVVLFVFLIAIVGTMELLDEVMALRWDAEVLATNCEREEHGVQNHFVSLSEIRPGWLRWALLWGWLRLVHIAARLLYNPHGLFNIPSIHFARWLIVPGRRLLFVPNYDGSFSGYLGQFSTFGAGGVSGIWGNTRDFPRTFLLFFGGGARDEQRYKARARASQQMSLFWYRRYPRLSVSAIERHGAIRADLLRFARSLEAGASRMSEAELDAFLRRF